MIRHRNGASRFSTVSTQHEGQVKSTTCSGQADHAAADPSASDNKSQDHSDTASPSTHEGHPLESNQIRAQTPSSGTAPSSSPHRQQGLEQAPNSTPDPISTTSAPSKVGNGPGHNVAPGTGYGRPGPRAGVQPLSDGTSVSINGTSYQIGGHYPDMSVFVNGPEDDDWLHEVNDSENPRAGSMRCDSRGLLNVGFLLVVCFSVITLFLGWPVLYYANTSSNHALWGHKVIALPEGPSWIKVLDRNGSLQRVTKSPLRGLIDRDTPASAMTKTSSDGKRKMKLVFSDEFNEDGRTFFEGDDPYWTAVDLHYWATGDFEWYSPLGATTKGGALRIVGSPKFTQIQFGSRPQSAMLQSWNKLCVQGGYLEARLILPGTPTVPGYWPAVWMMGNLGRAGYGATNDGMWPYNYDSCDVGTMPHQTYGPNGTGGPWAAEQTGAHPEWQGPALSYLPGQKLSRCTCPTSTDHPGPRHKDGSWMGRGASELDLLEGRARGIGECSMSFQAAPFNAYHNTTPGFTQVWNPNQRWNRYVGNKYQQSVSAIMQTSQTAYQYSGGNYSTYGVEYYRHRIPHVTWQANGHKNWRIDAGAFGPDKATEIGQRIVTPEPVIGMSNGFSPVDFENLKFPGVLSVDYVRVYQDEGMESLSCDGAFPSMPTVSYIKKYSEAYQNANLTMWTGSRKDGGYGHHL
ncbi:unnamed protein product [Tilletia controversa]|nr:unnamed protein product [Tilletia controversa]